MEVDTLDRRAALEEAFDSAEADAKGEPYTPPVREPAEPVEPAETETPDADPAKLEAKAAEQPKQKDRPRTRGVPPDERVKPEAEGKTPETTAPTASALDKAPVSWGAKRNELWGKVPSEVRAIISKRESEIQAGMSQAGRIRQIAEEYHQVIQPFENIIRSMNTTPREALTNVMQTATVLIIGTQAQKCAVLTEMIQRYGVDLPELDKMLTASIKGQGQKPAGRQQPVYDETNPIDPRLLKSLQPLFSLQQRLEAAEGQKHVQLQQEAVEAINTVNSEPYFEDVRDDMADIMEISAKRGHVMTIKEAYTKACQIHPEISKLIMTQTKRTPSDALARARRAASTVRGAPGGAVTNGKMDRRAALEAAWDQS
jgi:hypothetical protein